jgi:hypothetical protein
MRSSTLYILLCMVWAVSIIAASVYLAVTWDMGEPLLLWLFAGAYSQSDYKELIKMEITK